MWERENSISKDNSWNVCTRDATTNCAAVGFFFAHRVHQETGVPQGLLWNAVGGSTAKEWIPRFGWWLRPQLAETARQADCWYPETEVGCRAHRETLDGIDAVQLHVRQRITAVTDGLVPSRL
jgi:hypothetical protein